MADNGQRIVMRLPRLFQGRQPVVLQTAQLSDSVEGEGSKVTPQSRQCSLFDDRWDSLRKGLRQIVDSLQTTGITHEQWMDMYTTVYSVCAFDKGNVVNLYVNLCKFIKQFAHNVGQTVSQVAHEGPSIARVSLAGQDNADNDSLDCAASDDSQSCSGRDTVPIGTENTDHSGRDDFSGTTVVKAGGDNSGERRVFLLEVLKQWESYRLVGELTEQIFKYMSQKWIPYQQRSIQSIGGTLIHASDGRGDLEAAGGELVELLGADSGILDIKPLFMFFWRKEVIYSSTDVGETIREQLLGGIDDARVSFTSASTDTLAEQEKAIICKGGDHALVPGAVESQDDKEASARDSNSKGEVSIGLHALHNLIFSYVELGNGLSQPLTVYRESFEKSFLARTRIRLQELSNTAIQERSVSEYLSFAEGILKREEELASHLLHPTSQPRLVNVCRVSMVDVHFASLANEIPAMLKHQREDDLKRVYDLSRHNLDFIRTIAQHTKAYVKQEARDAIEGVLSGARTDSTGLTKKKAVEYVKELLCFRQRVWKWLSICFEQHSLVKQKAQEAFDDCLNRTLGPFRVVELLSFYCDMLLSKQEKLTEKVIEDTLENLLHLLSHVSDKDLFHETFRTHLARRLLLSGRQLDMDLERTMLGLIKVRCGVQFTKKPEGMFHDMELSQEITRKFLAVPGVNQGAPAISASILHQVNWPLSAKENIKEREPFSKRAREFERFFAEDQKSKKLIWLFKEGSVVLEANVRSKVDIVMTPYQAMVMLLFNEREIWTFGDILGEIGGSEEDLQLAMGPLLFSKTRLLRRAKKSVGRRLLLSDRLAIHPQIGGLIGKRSWPKRVVLKRGMESDILHEDKEKALAVEEDRRFQVDAAIVRVMKSRRTLSHTHLTAEVSDQLMSHFKPDPKLIKERIASLMEMDFLERDINDPKVYKYLA